MAATSTVTKLFFLLIPLALGRVKLIGRAELGEKEEDLRFFFKLQLSDFAKEGTLR